MNASIDWVSFTVPFDKARVLLDLFPGGVTWMDRGWSGYTNMGVVADGKGRVGLSPGREEMGCHVALGSQALGILAGGSELWADLQNVVQVVQDVLGGHFTRVDVAFDDRREVLDLGVILEHVKKGWLTSRWRKGFQKRGLDLAGGGFDGETLEFGRRVSNAMLRCYDKRAERVNAGEDDPGPWIRAELELKRDRADAAAELYKKGDVGEFFSYIAGVLRGYLEFKTPNEIDSNKRRWAVAGWWSEFLEGAEKARLEVREKVRRTVEHVKEWFNSQVAPSLAVIYDWMGEELGAAWVQEQQRAGRLRWKARHRAILAASG